MKTPLWFPQSFFARTLWMVLIVVLFSKVLMLVYLRPMKYMVFVVRWVVLLLGELN